MALGGDTAQLLIEYRYWILIPLMFLEGPVAAFVAGGLAATGVFNVWVLAVLFFVRDVGLDGVYYAIGHYSGRSKFAKKMLKKMHVTEDHLDQVRLLWEKYPARTMFVGKLSYGIASAFIVVAGIIHMPIRKFFIYGSLVAVAQYGSLLVLGYFFGTSLGGSIGKVIENIQYGIAGVTIFATLYFGVTWYMKGTFIKSDEKASQEPLT